MMESYSYPAKEIPFIPPVDVLVAGGGYAGFGAALAAARNGAKVLLVEQQSCLGGLVTMGYVGLAFSYVEGVGVDLFAALKDKDAIKGRFLDLEKTKQVMEDMLLKAGVQILYCTSVVDAIVEDGVIRGAVLFNKSGYSAVMASRVIDTSGDGDLAAYAGVPFEVGSPDHDGCNQSASLVCRVGNVNMEEYKQCGKRFPGDTLLRYNQEMVEKAVESGDFPYMIDKRFNWVVTIPGRDPLHQELFICYAHSRNCRCLDAFDITRMLIEGREQNRLLLQFLRKYMPGFADCWLIDTAPLLGVRDSRRIMCEYKMKAIDLIEGRRFEDAVLRDMHAFDAHHPTDVGHIKHIPIQKGDGTVEKAYVMPGTFREIPYRALVTLKIDNLLIAGRNISSDFMAQSGTRLVMACLNMGQAAGTAAALSIREGVTPRALDYKLLQARLLEMGVTLDADPAYGVANVDTHIKVRPEDISIPTEGDRFHVHAVAVKNSSITVSADADEELRRHTKGYTDTGGDVGTNME